MQTATNRRLPPGSFAAVRTQKTKRSAASQRSRIPDVHSGASRSVPLERPLLHRRLNGRLGLDGRARRVVPARSPSVAWSSRDHGLSQAKAGLPCFHRRMPGSEADKTSFDLRNLSLSRFKLDGCRRRLDISARVCAGASLALSHRQPDGLKCWFWSMRGGIKEAALLPHDDP
jgi:hypothetical protein